MVEYSLLKWAISAIQGVCQRCANCRILYKYFIIILEQNVTKVFDLVHKNTDMHVFDTLICSVCPKVEQTLYEFGDIPSIFL